MVVYLDIIWLLNLFVDTFLLWATAIVMKKSIPTIRLFIGGFLGSIFIFLAVTPIAAIATHPISKGIVSICMVLIVFGYKRFSNFATHLLTFYFMTFLMGGILLGTHYFLSFQIGAETVSLVQQYRGFGDPVSWLFVIIAFPIAWHFSRQRITGITLSNIQYDILYETTVKINEIQFSLKGFVDSGNQLFDPISKTPVMIISVHKLQDLLPSCVLQLADNNKDIYDLISSLDAEWSSLMRLIPAKTLGNDQNLLCAFKPDFILIKDKNGVEKSTNGFIVFTNQVLSSDDRFDVIIHPLMVGTHMMHTAS